MKKTIIVSLLFILSVSTYSQGCSDAGMCTVNGLSSGFEDETKKSTVKVSTIFGLGEQNVFHADLEMSAEYETFKNQLLQVRLGDMIISINQRVATWKEGWLSVVAGVKLPVNDANKSLDGNPLPMAYQTSLGTYDIIFGAGGYYKKWHFSAGYQHSFGRNDNEFEHRDDNPQYFNDYRESYHLLRADDVMLRVERQFDLKKSSLIFGALPIYHLGSDKIKNDQVVPDSEGLTLNLTAKLNLALKNDWKANFMLAAPIIDKDGRPDGLTRSFVAVVAFAKQL